MKKGFAKLALLLTLCSLNSVFAQSIEKASNISFGTFNIRYFSASVALKSIQAIEDDKAAVSTNLSLLRSLINNTNADLLAVQEIIDAQGLQEFVKRYFSQYALILSKCGGSGRQKLGFLYRKSKLILEDWREDMRISENSSCNQGIRPAVVANFRERASSGLKFTAIAVHLKAGGTPDNADVRFKQLATLATMIKEESKKSSQMVVTMGDFNTTEHITRDQNYYRFQSFLRDNDLIDYAERLNCTAYWHGGLDDGFAYPSVLDHIIVTEAFHQKYSRVQVEAQSHCKKLSCEERPETQLGATFEEVSDHCPVVARFR
jgi:endonuclease/exonuclease/phosphatase family metal-dependent hydrolase